MDGQTKWDFGEKDKNKKGKKEKGYPVSLAGSKGQYADRLAGRAALALCFCSKRRILAKGGGFYQNGKRGSEVHQGNSRTATIWYNSSVVAPNLATERG